MKIRETQRRVLSLDPAGLLWGSERALLDFLGMIPGFSGACCLPPGSPLIAKLRELEIPHFPYFKANLHQRGVLQRGIALLGLMRAIRQFRPHVIHVNQAGATKIALAACKVFKIPCVSHVRLLEDVEYLNRIQPSPHHLKHLISVSPPIAEEIDRQPGLQSIPRTMLLDAYRPFGVQGSNPSPPPTWDFACVGRLSESKGQELLIRALMILERRGLRPRTVILGDLNQHGHELQELVRDAGLIETVQFFGYHEQVGEVLRRTKWLVCASRYETLGRVLFEAWDFGIPVIAGATSGGAAVSVSTSGGGLLFGEWNASSLADCLQNALATTPTDYVRMARNGRNWMVNATQPDQYAACISRIFDQVIDDSRP